MKHYDVLTTGFVSMDRIVKIKSPARVGYTSLISNRDNAQIYYGGCPINIAYLLARLGCSSLPIVRVGDDYEDIGFAAFLRQGGVGLDALTVVPDETTSNCYMLEDDDGQHITLFYPGAQDSKYYQPLPDDFFPTAKFGVITVGPTEDNLEFYRQCRKFNVPLIFGMKADFESFPDGVLEELLRYSTIIFTNEHERAEIEQRLGLHAITDLLETANARIIITTLGKAGSSYFTRVNGQILSGQVGVANCNQVVDTTGSGDAYMAGFIYGLMQGQDTEACCRMGSVVASFILEAMGCCTNAPSPSQLQERYEQSYNQTKIEVTNT